MEQWKDIPGYEGRYQVSDLGRVRGVKGSLRPQPQNSGYLVVHLYLDGVRRVRLVHTLVAEAFVNGWFAGAEVNHRDTKKVNNCATNLEWVTRSKNIQHAYANGHKGPTRFAVVGTPLNGGFAVRFNSQLDAEKALAGKASSAINHCLTGKKKSAYGYTWSRA